MAKNKKKEVKVQTQKAEKIHEKHLKKLQDLVNLLMQYNLISEKWKYKSKQQ